MAKCRQRNYSCSWKLIVVFASFSNSLLIVGVNHCTGILFASFQNEFRSTTAETAAISSIMTSSTFFGATIGGALGNVLGCRITAMIGGFCTLIGMIWGALTSNIYSFYVASVVIGLGSGILYTPSVVVLAQYFNKGYGLACGLRSCGIGIGMIVYGPLVQTLLDTYGWRGTIIIMGAILANTIAAGAIFRPVKPHHKVQEQQEMAKLNNRTVEKSPKSKKKCHATTIVKLFRLNLLRSSYRVCVVCFAHCTYVSAYYCFSIYLVSFATSLGILNTDAAFLFSISGITSIVGRLLCGVICGKLSAQVIYQLTMLVCGGSILITLLGTYTYFVLSSAILGFGVGFYQTIVLVVVRDFVGVDNFGSAVGMISLLSGVAGLLGPVLAGALYDVNGSYFVLFAIFGGLFFLGFLPTLLFPYLKRIEPGIADDTVGK
ncbi:monocarboxylate transporter 12-like [Asterias amurensis]|uniref:monocarboxylate transporter 12-like n=1 Tax=Asterias amurensis TaxID=7602 RepID=UPI003AB14E08